MRIRTLLFFLFFSGSVFATEYEIAAQFVTETMHPMCSFLEVIDAIREEEKKENFTDEDRNRIKQVEDSIKDDIRELSRVVAYVTLSVKLPARLVMNKENFFITGIDDEKIGTFASDLLLYMDEDGVVTIDGSGAASFNINLKQAAFCQHITDENKSPSVETVLAELIKKS